jgi:hypothetical protein
MPFSRGDLGGRAMGGMEVMKLGLRKRLPAALLDKLEAG